MYFIHKQFVVNSFTQLCTFTLLPYGLVTSNYIGTLESQSNIYNGVHLVGK